MGFSTNPQYLMYILLRRTGSISESHMLILLKANTPFDAYNTILSLLFHPNSTKLVVPGYYSLWRRPDMLLSRASRRNQISIIGFLSWNSDIFRCVPGLQLCVCILVCVPGSVHFRIRYFRLILFAFRGQSIDGRQYGTSHRNPTWSIGLSHWPQGNKMVPVGGSLNHQILTVHFNDLELSYIND